MPTPMKVVGLHKLPFDEAGFAKDMESVADHAPESIAELTKQYRGNWDNAWLVVVEWEGPANQIDFGGFQHPQPGPYAQVPWLEEILDDAGGRTRAAFYLHDLELDKPLWYKNQRLKLPAPSPAPEELLKLLPYESPD